MDWVMCLLPFAVCFVGFLAAAKVTKKKKRILAAAGVVLFLAAAFGSLAVYRNQKITKPIRDSELLAVAELRLDAFLGNAELNDFQTDRLTELYGALGHYLNSLVYLPCINQDTFDAGTQDVILQFGTEEEVKLWLAFYPDRRICLFRSDFDAPDIDTLILVPVSQPIEAGAVRRVRITALEEPDVRGELVENAADRVYND